MLEFTQRLAAFMLETPPSQIPTDCLQAARDAVGDTVAVILAGVTEQPARIAQDWAREMAAPGKSRVLGTALRVAPAEAAFANGVAAHALDFDDTHPHFSHPSATLVPSLLAAGEALGASGADLLTSYVLALELGTRLGPAIGHGHYMRGWHASATIGIFASTAAAARLYGLTNLQLRHAWGIAGSMTAGLIRNFGTMTKPFHLGHAARSALLAVHMAKAGFTADIDIFDGKGGFLHVYGEGDGQPLADLADSLGTTWKLTAPGLYVKGWPCCYCNHRPVGGLFKIMAEHGLTAGSIESVQVGFLPGADQPLLKDNPQTGLEGKFSIEYAAAAALLDGALDFGSFTDAAVRRPEIRKLMTRVSRYRIPAEKSYSGINGYMDIAVRTKAETYEMRVEEMPGSILWPLTREQKQTKFNTCVARTLPADRAVPLQAATEQLIHLAELGELTALAAP